MQTDGRICDQTEMVRVWSDSDFTKGFARARAELAMITYTLPNDDLSDTELDHCYC